MSPKNRGDRIQLLVKAVQKNFTPVLAPSDRSLLEHLLYACCLEDASYEAADEAFHRLQESFFDWNEVRVTTITELVEHLHNLPEPKAAAVRIKKNLQTVFETRYSFDLQDMIKMNQGKAIAELEKFGGMSRYVLAYMTQNGLGGHAIPVSHNIMRVLLRTEVVTEAEAGKQYVPGLERSVAKSKGAAFSSCLHQMGLLLVNSPQAKQTLTILKESGASLIEKKPHKPTEQKSPSKKAPPAKPSKQPESHSAASSVAASSESGSKSATGKKPVATKKEAEKSPNKEPITKKPAAKSSPAKAGPPKLPASKAPQAKTPKPKSTPEKSANQKRKPK